MIDPKNRSMICRMAGNIAGPLLASNVATHGWADNPAAAEAVAESAVRQAVAIVAEVDHLIEQENKWPGDP